MLGYTAGSNLILKKRLDCPYCGGVVLHSAEQAVYAREQLRTDRNSVYIDTKK